MPSSRTQNNIAFNPMRRRCAIRLRNGLSSNNVLGRAKNCKNRPRCSSDIDERRGLKITPSSDTAHPSIGRRGMTFALKETNSNTRIGHRVDRLCQSVRHEPTITGDTSMAETTSSMKNRFQEMGNQANQAAASAAEGVKSMAD